jgi:hypothetical protein
MVIGSSLDSPSARMARFNRWMCNPFEVDQVRGMYAGEDLINPFPPQTDPTTREYSLGDICTCTGRMVWYLGWQQIGGYEGIGG